LENLINKLKNQQKTNLKKPQFLPSEIERKYHFGINNEIYSKILKETLANSTEGISPQVSSKFRFKEKRKTKQNRLALGHREKIGEKQTENAAAEDVLRFVENHLT
jgi:hypothetical protein